MPPAVWLWEVYVHECSLSQRIRSDNHRSHSQPRVLVTSLAPRSLKSPSSHSYPLTVTILTKLCCSSNETKTLVPRHKILCERAAQIAKTPFRQSSWLLTSFSPRSVRHSIQSVLLVFPMLQVLLLNHRTGSRGEDGQGSRGRGEGRRPGLRS